MEDSRNGCFAIQEIMELDENNIIVQPEEAPSKYRVLGKNLPIR
jgi:hypothetical protein